MNPNTDAPRWFFMWKDGSPYITKICGWSRRAVRETVTRENQCSWRQLYRRGGRIIKVEWRLP